MSDLQPLRPIARRALSAQSDERLVRLVREGHGPAFEEIVRRYRGPLIAFAAAIVPSSGAEDVVQGSLAKAHAALLEDEREISLRPWLFAIVRNGALNSVRGQPRVDELDEAMAAHSNPSEIAEQRDDLDRLVLAMCALPEAQRQALVKRELEGVGHGEIAAQLGTTSTAVRGLIFRARTQLRNALGLLVPLPLLRSLIAQGSAAGIASAGAAGGGASALLGSAGAKGGAVLAATVLAIGSGIAIEKRHRDGGDVERAAAAADPIGARAGSERNAARAEPVAAGGATTDAGHPDASGHDGPGRGGGDGGDDAGDDSTGHSEGGPSGGSSHGSGSGSPSGDSSGSSGDGGDDLEPPSEPDHSESGHGSGHDDESEYEPPEEDSSGPSDDDSDDDFDADSSGPGSGHEISGSGGQGEDDRA